MEIPLFYLRSGSEYVCQMTEHYTRNCEVTTSLHYVSNLDFINRISKNELFFRSSNIQQRTDNIDFYRFSERLIPTYAIPHTNQTENTKVLPLSIDKCYSQRNHDMAHFNQRIDHFNHIP